MTRVGIVGFGKMGQTRASAIAASGLGEVVAIYDPNGVPSIMRRVEATSAESIIEAANIDAVFICTPNYLNKPLTIKALNAGKHVFCEKPPAFTAADVSEIRKHEADNLVLMYGFNHRHHESIKRMKAIVSSNEMGRILWMRGRYGKEVSSSFFDGWRAAPDLAGGGIMLDQGIHMLDLMIYLGGNFDEVQSLVSNLFWKIPGIEDNVFVNLRSSTTGVCASIHSTMTQWRYLFSLEVFLEEGALILNGLKTSSGAYGTEQLSIKHNQSSEHSGTFATEELIEYHSNTSWASETSLFFDCISKCTRPPLGSTDDALKVMDIMDRIYGRT